MVEVVSLLREFGFPTFFCLWLMWRVEKELREQRRLMAKQVMLAVAIAKTLDIEVEADTGELPAKKED